MKNVILTIWGYDIYRSQIGRECSKPMNKHGTQEGSRALGITIATSILDVHKGKDVEGDLPYC